MGKGVRVYGGEEGEDREDGRGIAGQQRRGTRRRGQGYWFEGKEEGEGRGGPETRDIRTSKNSHSSTKCPSETLTP